MGGMEDDHYERRGDGLYPNYATADDSSDEELPPDERYCDLCERYGHTFRTCARRDDNG